jgi:hypothetical protein
MFGIPVLSSLFPDGLISEAAIAREARKLGEHLNRAAANALDQAIVEQAAANHVPRPEEVVETFERYAAAQQCRIEAAAIDGLGARDGGPQGRYARVDGRPAVPRIRRQKRRVPRSRGVGGAGPGAAADRDGRPRAPGRRAGCTAAESAAARLPRDRRRDRPRCSEGPLGAGPLLARHARMAAVQLRSRNGLPAPTGEPGRRRDEAAGCVGVLGNRATGRRAAGPAAGVRRAPRDRALLGAAADRRPLRFFYEAGRISDDGLDAGRGLRSRRPEARAREGSRARAARELRAWGAEVRRLRLCGREARPLPALSRRSRPNIG